MILLDTDVLSALMQSAPDPAVVRWLDLEEPTQVWTTAITVFEIRFGLSRLPEGARRRALESASDTLIGSEFAGRIAPVDRNAAEAAGRLATERAAKGRPVDVLDTLMAGVAISRRAAVATRNLRHFSDLDIPAMDPWAF